MTGIGGTSGQVIPINTVSVKTNADISLINNIPANQICATIAGELFYYDPTSSAAVDGTTVLATASGVGRWLNITPGSATAGEVKVTVNDTTSGFLASKIVEGSGITLTVLNPGGNETLEATATPAGSASAAVDMAGFLLTVDAIEGNETPEGNITGTATFNNIPYTTANMTGNVTITLPSPTAGMLLSNRIELTNDTGGVGGFTPTFTGYTFIGTEPVWASQAAGTITLLSYEHTPTDIKTIWSYREI